MEKLIPEGVYDAEIATAEDAVSKTSNKPMLKLSVRVFNGDRSVLVNDYIVNDQQDKLYSLCASGGILDIYHAGEVEPFNLVDLPVQVKVGIDSKNSDYPPKNVIKRYVKPKSEKREPAGTGYSGSQVANVNRQLEESSDGDDTPF